MPDRSGLDARHAELLRQMMSLGDDGPTTEQKLGLARLIREESSEASEQLDAFLLGEVSRLHKGLSDARRQQMALQNVFKKLSAPPWHAAIFLQSVDTERGPAAMVMHNGTRRVVNASDQVNLATLEPGDEVLLGPEMNVVVAKSQCSPFYSGETAVFERPAGGRRIVLRSRDEEIVVATAAALDVPSLRTGDLVRWDRGVWMAFERIERSQGTHLFLEEMPTETFAAVGGLDLQIELMKRVLRLHYEHAEIASKYGLRRKGAVLLVGPPGNGKTLVARALANWVGQLSRSGRSRFMSVKPGCLHSMWYAQSEANYREAFRVAREAGEREPEMPVVMFFDEVDSVGTARGQALSGVDDRVLTAFMTELDGLEARGNILVVAATNRRDSLDPALLRAGRLGDVILEIPRPDRRAAREIFAKHLSDQVPYRNGEEGSHGAARVELIDAAVSRIYSPNGEGELASLTFRDGKRRGISARNLVSGAVIAKICQAAVERAAFRDVELGDEGVRLSDLLDVIDDEFRTSVRNITPRNCHRHLEGLPQDVDVVSVDVEERRVKRAHRYLSVA